MAERNDTPDFCTLGMFIIDEIHFPPPQPSVYDVLGGAGTYSAVGARLFSPPPLSSSVGWIVDCGSDFPAELRNVVAQWETGVLMKETPERLTTRGWNGYGENEYRAFKYLTPKLRVDETALNPRLLTSKSFHLICSPLRCIVLVEGILKRRNRLSLTRPLFIWEPVPDTCIPSEMPNFLKALLHVDIVSPNHSELGGIFNHSLSWPNGDVDVQGVQRCCDAFLHHGVGPESRGAMVVRAGKDGCYIASNTEMKRWLPAVHPPSSKKVVDPTGGGNGFLGGFAVGLVRWSREAGHGFGRLQEAAIWGSVAASFCIEQVGMPILERSRTGQEEMWNGDVVMERVEQFQGHTFMYEQPQ
ncbi:MAK32-like protein [Cryomyces antarcticus]